MHKNDKNLLLEIKDFLGGIGTIYERKSSCYCYRIIKRNELDLLIKHFDTYPLLTKKYADFQLFKEIFIILNEDSKMTLLKLNKILNLKASLNWGLSNKLKKSFKDFEIFPQKRIYNDSALINSYWVSGFVSGDGCFKIFKNNDKVQLRFRITQHTRDEILKKKLLKFLRVGNTYYYKKQKALHIEVLSFIDIKHILIPFFNKYNLLGTKHLTFLEWIKVYELKDKGLHLSKEGKFIIEEIEFKINKK